MRVEVDQSRCVGSGQCVIRAPTVFDQDDNGLVIVIDESPPGELRDAVLDAQAICPAAVIRVKTE
jgi:ferredoxin